MDIYLNLPAVVSQFIVERAIEFSYQLLLVLLPLCFILVIGGIIIARKKHGLSGVMILSASLFCCLGALVTEFVDEISFLPTWLLLTVGCCFAFCWPLFIVIQKRFLNNKTKHKTDQSDLEIDSDKQKEFTRTSQLDVSEQMSLEKTRWYHYGLLFIIIAALAPLYLYRLDTYPPNMDRYGSGVVITANRWLTHQLDLKDLILYREMTQAESSYSLPIVLWYAFFQKIMGGISVYSGRLPSLVATLLSSILLFRIGCYLSGPFGGLVAVSFFGTFSLTLMNARSEAIFSSSSLLILLVVNQVLAFISKPNWFRAILLGLVIPLVGYGIANIRLNALAVIALILWLLLFDKKFRSSALKKLMLIVLIASILLVPQFLNFNKVLSMIEGRGEHMIQVFQEHNWHPSAFDKVKPQLMANINYLVKLSWGDKTLSTSLVPSTTILMLLGLSLCFGSICRAQRFFIILFWFSSYVGPLLAIPIYHNRVLMLGVGQALVISVFFQEIYSQLTKFRWRIFGLLLISGFVFLFCFVQLTSINQMNKQNFLSGIASRLNEIEYQGLVFYVDQEANTDLLYLRSHSARIGSNSNSPVQLIGIRQEDIAAVCELAMSLDIKVLIISLHDDPVLYKHEQSRKWRRIYLVSYSLPYTLEYNSFKRTQDVLVVAREAIRLTNKSPVHPYNSKWWFDNSLSKLANLRNRILTIELNIPQDLNQAYILVRILDSKDAIMDVRTLNIILNETNHFRVEIPLHKKGLIGLAACELASELKAGRYFLKLSTNDIDHEIYVDDLIIVGVVKKSR